MRTLMQVEIDRDTANELIDEGMMSDVLNRILGNLKPEAAYFHPRNGRRCMTLVVDIPDEASIVPICEPFFMELNASIEFYPCMNADDLQTGFSRLTKR